MRDVRVCFFGDSLVAGVGDPSGRGWVGRLAAAAFDAGLPVTAYNLGVRRETSGNVRGRWRRELEPRLAEAAECRVVFSFGANDAPWEDGRPRIDRASSVANLERLLAEARALAVPVMVVGPPPINDVAQQQRLRALSKALGDAADRAGERYVELAAVLGGSPEWQRELDAGDGAHPGDRGYAAVAGIVEPAWLDWLRAA